MCAVVNKAVRWKGHELIEHALQPEVSCLDTASQLYSLGQAGYARDLPNKYTVGETLDPVT